MNDGDGPERIYDAPHLARNPASGRVMEKCGMRVLCTETRDHRGAREDFCIRGITRDAWARVSGESEAPRVRAATT